MLIEARTKNPVHGYDMSYFSLLAIFESPTATPTTAQHKRRIC